MWDKKEWQQQLCFLSIGNLGIKCLTLPHQAKELGLTGNSRHFVPDYAGRTESLRALVKAQGCRNLSAKLDWTVEADSDFICLKQDLSQATSLAPPDYTQPFFLDVSERQASAYGVLYQKQRGIRRVLIYCSVRFDVQEKRAASCVRYAAAVAKLTEEIAPVVMHHPLIILTSHATVAFVTSSAFTLTPLRQSRILKVLTQPHITFVHQGINMAEQILEGTPHCCITATKDRTKVRTDLSETPLVNPEVEIYTDGCCFRHPDRGLQAGYAVVELGIDGTPRILKQEQMTGSVSAQKAELRAVISALELSQEKSANIYTDSAYVYNAVHRDLTGWMQAGFRTSGGKSMAHERMMRELAEALQLPKRVAIMKVKGHSTLDDREAKGNDAADQAAKQAAGYTVNMIMLVTDMQIADDVNMETVKAAQETASQEIKTQWKSKGGQQNSQGIWHVNSQVIMPPQWLNSMLTQTHGPDHRSTGQMTHDLRHWWIDDSPTGESFSTREQEPELGSGGPPEFLYLKAIKRKWSEQRWTGSFKVTARTNSAVKLAGKGYNWYHLSQCAKNTTAQEKEAEGNKKKK
ncbi:uncharacterized protein LOC130179704 isoform X2 [Seriola aureovittata]|uniref:uncharacterized protein LOC130179704 isoform X2 n=1 Tax=Seriola aureovittata TaxID=2871759 RepID=UPI0024BDCB8D|nr:uncharacterized protein LOC130179704 isoform X2 [Seriola aureovittata]